MYHTVMTPYINHLNNLKAILTKAIAWQTENKIADEVIMGARLALDMFPLTSQVRIATNFARNSAAILCGLDNPVYEDNEKTLQELQGRIDKVIAYIESLSDDMVKNDLETRVVPLPWMPGKGLTAKYYLESYAHSNFYFHYTTAYAILRHYGLQIGKSDYMGNLMSSMKDIA